MAIPRIDYSPPDYSERISRGLASAAQVAEGMQPAHPLVQQALRRVYSGEDPRAVGIETKLALARQQPLPAMPEPLPATPAAPLPPGAEAVGMRGTMRSSLAPEGSFTGPREFTGPEEVVTAPRPTPTGSRPVMSDPATAEAPILNRDLPLLMQGARLMRSTDLDALSRQRLLEQQRQFTAEAPLRRSLVDLRQAQIAALPKRLEQGRERIEVSKENTALGRARLGLSEAVQYLKYTQDAPQMVASIENLLSRVNSSPGLAPPPGDYFRRRVSDILNRVPVAGGAAGEYLNKVSDELLTQPQRDIRRQVALIAQNYIHANFGSALTAHELAIANELVGQQTSWADTMAGLRALQFYGRNRLGMAGRAFPAASRRIGGPTPQEALPPPSSGLPPELEGFLPDLPGEF